MTDAQTPTDELLPCPFCGGAGRIDREHCLDGGGVFLTVKCGKCRATSGEKYHSHGNDCPQTYQEVRDAWNTRTIAALPPAVPEQTIGYANVYRDDEGEFDIGSTRSFQKF